MKDLYQRNIDYLRVSITDRCNLRCQYCMPQELPLLPHGDILRYEEILRICGIAASLGIRNLKITGGEPLARRDAVEFLAKCKEIPGIEHVTLTTNGVLLSPHIQAMKNMGLDGVNISLDALDPDTYRKISGRDVFAQAWRGFLAAVESGVPVKLNIVPMRGQNEGEIVGLAALAASYPVDVRFIELMPIGSGSGCAPIPGDEILALLQNVYPDLSPDPRRHGCGPARYWLSAALKGSIGFIDAVSHNFCDTCNRIRLTSEGFLKPCLYHSEGYDLRAELRNGADDEQIAATIKKAIRTKPKKHAFYDLNRIGERRAMSQIGG